MVADGRLSHEQWHVHRHDSEGATPAPQAHERIAQHYRFVLSTMFHVAAPGARHVVILEEDLIVSPDILSYFATAAPGGCGWVYV